MTRIVDIQQLRVLDVDDSAPPLDHFHAEVLIVGGGLGGVAAALSAGQAGRTVCLVEETDWLGGQATSQGVSALDENQYIETSGGTRSYLAFRSAIRDWYRQHRTLAPAAHRRDSGASPHFNPGSAWVSRLCFEPRVALAVIDDLLRPYVEGGHLRVMTRCKACAVAMDGDRVAHVDVVHLDTADRSRITPAVVIDATELGDLLALGAAEFVTGAESRADTAEPHTADDADPGDVQSFTYTFAIEHRPGERHPIPKPPDYDRNRDHQPYTLTIHYHDGRVTTFTVFEPRPESPRPFWRYRRLIDAAQFDDPACPHDVAMINWPGNDYRGGSILVRSPEEQLAHLRAAKDLSLGFLYWLQYDAPRDDGGLGHPEFKLRPDVMGSDDGLSKFPYVRESRRIVPLDRILEQQIARSDDPSAAPAPRADHFPDSVGIGLYAIDFHESKRNRKQKMLPARPFQIPLSALIPRRTTNLLAACKNIGTTHVTNGCYRLHPVEWNIGESAGETAAMAVEHAVSPRALREDAKLLLELQHRLARRGVPLMWYDDLPVNDPRFEQLHLLPFHSPDVLPTLTKNLHAPPVPQ